MKAILVDDEIPMLENLQLKIEEYCKDVQIIGTSTNLKDAAELINKEEPDVLFLDIEIPPGTGFDLLKMINHDKIEIVFVTAYDQYALQAIKNKAFDYLLKPAIISELIDVVEKLKFKLQTNPPNHILTSPSEQINKIEVSHSNGVSYIDVNDIVRIKGDGPYSEIFTLNGETLYLSKTLKYFESKLINYKIIRIHKSHMINLNMVKSFDKTDGGAIVLKNGDKIELSNSYKEVFLKVMKDNCI